MADLHAGLESYIEGRAENDVARFVRTQLRRTRDDVVYVLHVVPVRAPGVPTLADTLSMLGFTFTKQCPVQQKRADCFALEVARERSVEDLANHVLAIWGHGQQAAAHLGACGIPFPEPWRRPGLIQGLVGRAMQQPQIVEGHEAETQSRRGDFEDDTFRYRLTWIEQRTTRGWVLHYEPKQPLPDDTVEAMTLLGLQPYAACQMLEFRPCFWRAITMPPAATFHDPSADRVRSEFNAHYANFVPALQALIAAERVAQEIGLHVLPPRTSAVEAQQDDAEARTHNQSLLGFMRHAALRSIAERDHTDLLGLLAAPGQLKAKIVLAGAVVEAVLLDDIVGDDAAIPPELLGLTLGGLVTEARRRGAKVSDRVANLAAVAKDYRNDAHPGRELRQQALAPEDVEVAVALMNAVLREHRMTPPP